MHQQTEHEQRMHDHYAAIEDENFHLKRQLANKNKQIRALKASYRAINDKYKKLVEQRKPRFRNNNRGGK